MKTGRGWCSPAVRRVRWPSQRRGRTVRVSVCLYSCSGQVSVDAAIVPQYIPAVDVADFDFPLPDELIAQQPAPRGQSRMLVLDRGSGARHHASIADLPSFLQAGDLVVVNNTRVFAARLLRSSRAERRAVDACCCVLSLILIPGSGIRRSGSGRGSWGLGTPDP